MRVCVRVCGLVCLGEEKKYISHLVGTGFAPENKKENSASIINQQLQQKCSLFARKQFTFLN